MSKHGNSEGKLHISREVRGRSAPTKQPPANLDNAAPQVPKPGTNAKNQFR